MTNEQLLITLKAVADADLSPAEAVEHIIEQRDQIPLKDLIIDSGRERRTGFPETIYGEGKTLQHLRLLLISYFETSTAVLITRASEEKASILCAEFPRLNYDEIGTCLWWNPNPEPTTAPVAIVVAGTSDLPVAREAATTLKAYGCGSKMVVDVGVAGIHRLFARLEGIRQHQVLIVVAGMEGALASVLTGLVTAPVICVPTSVGYGSHLQGLTALLGMLNSCASGSTVVNIDNGFGAAMAALRMLSAQYPTRPSLTNA